MLILVLKSRLKTSDKLPVAILACFVIKFSLDEVSLISDSPNFNNIGGAFGINFVWVRSLRRIGRARIYEILIAIEILPLAYPELCINIIHVRFNGA